MPLSPSPEVPGAAPAGEPGMQRRTAALPGVSGRAAQALDPAFEPELFRAIVASSDDAIIGKTLDGTVCSWNEGAERLFGYTAQEMIGRSLLLLFPPDRLEEEGFIIERILDGERVDHFETVRLRKDGRPVAVSVTISPVRDRSGRIVGASKIARDITAHQLAQARLQLISSVFTWSSEAIVITDAAGVIVDVNAAFTEITGYDRQEVLGQDHRLFSSSRQGPEVYAALWAALQRDGHCRGEVWSRRKDGVSYAGLLTVSAVRDDAGRVQHYVALFADITPLRVQQERLEHLAQFDALTDLPNRLLLSDRLHQAIAVCQRHQQTLAVVYLDLDGFKLVNDHHGHDVGDELLVAVSRRMKHALREVDTLARIGGDEFVAVLVDVHGPQECRLLVERILAACAEPVTLGDRVLQVSASIGVTLYPQDHVDADQLMRHADQAMYEAKQAGRNRYQMFDAVQDAAFKSRGEQLRRIGLGLRRGEFVLHYQPKVNMRSGEVVGAEALVRWQHPERGLLLPGEFLPLIERDPLLDALGLWVIDAALAQMGAWLAAGLDLAVSVNVGARQFQEAHFAAHLAQALALHAAVPPASLELEILETSALADVAVVSSIMRDCRRLGVRFAIDDFGTGYSSLTYLKRLPAETLKIDQSFVCHMLDDHEDLAIVQGVIGLAAAFRRQVIAEGVETQAQGERLLELGCEQAQGYGIARPMPAAQLPAWVARWQCGARWLTPRPSRPSRRPRGP